MEQPGNSSQRERPKCIAIVICNEIIEDKRTNNKTLVGVFNTINTFMLPAPHPRMFILVSLTDGVGQWLIRFVITDADNVEVLRLEGAVPFLDPLQVYDVVFEIQMLPLQKPGTHFVDVFADGEHLSGRRFEVHLFKEGSI